MFVETAACAMDQPLKDKGSAFSLSKKVERVSHAANDEEDTTDIGSHTRQAVTRPQEHQIEDPRHNEEETSKKKSTSRINIVFSFRRGLHSAKTCGRYMAK